MAVILILLLLMAVVTIRECIKISKIKDNERDSYINGKENPSGS